MTPIQTPTQEEKIMNKKITAAVVTMAVVLTAGAALANDGIKCPNKAGRPDCKKERMCPKMTAKQKAQFEKMKKLQDELRTELKKDNPDKAKARALNNQIVDLRMKASAERFEKMLNSPRPKDCPKMSEAQKARMKKMNELREAIRAELEKDTPDKAKATALHNQLLQLRKECEIEGFEHILSNPKKFCDKGQCKKGFPPCDGRGPKPDCEF